jgi:hypothetical protein
MSTLLPSVPQMMPISLPSSTCATWAVGGGMIMAVDYDVAQELANTIGADYHAKYGSAPDKVVVDGQSYVPLLPPA